MNVLLTSIGRRGALLQQFKRAAAALSPGSRIVGCDMNPRSVGYQLAHVGALVPRVTDPGYVDRLLEICNQHAIQLVVPLIDTELPILAEALPRFREHGVTAVVSAPSVIAISNDKLATARFFEELEIPTPRVLDRTMALAGEYPFPIFIKPLNGSSSIGSRRLDSLADLEYWLPRTDEPLLLEFLEGREYTIDVYVGLDGTAHCAVPRRRLQVRAGEVEKGITENHPTVIDTALRAARALRGGVGVLTFQCIVDSEGRAYFFELNARFGGGAPLSIHAGADFPRWLIEERLGKLPTINDPAFRDGVLMLRWDDAVFVETTDQT